MINGLNPYQAITFTDGAYSQNKNKCGYGVVLFTQGNKETYDKELLQAEKDFSMFEEKYSASSFS